MIRPILVLDSKESWRPVRVEQAVEVKNVRLITISNTVKKFNQLSDLDRTISRIDFPETMETVIGGPGVGYHRMVKGGGLYWHQFWTFWLYNPKEYMGFGAHEGDFEFTQLGCTDPDGEKPVLATGSQHHSGGKREYWRVVRKDDRPVFYVARGSHANYFTPTNDLEDRADGKGLVLDEIEWREFGDWVEWPGHWGNSDNSPRSPMMQGHRWYQPHIYHGQAR